MVKFHEIAWPPKYYTNTHTHTDAYLLYSLFPCIPCHFFVLMTNNNENNFLPSHTKRKKRTEKEWRVCFLDSLCGLLKFSKIKNYSTKKTLYFLDKYASSRKFLDCLSGGCSRYFGMCCSVCVILPGVGLHQNGAPFHVVAAALAAQIRHHDHGPKWRHRGTDEFARLYEGFARHARRIGTAAGVELYHRVQEWARVFFRIDSSGPEMAWKPEINRFKPFLF